MTSQHPEDNFQDLLNVNDVISSGSDAHSPLYRRNQPKLQQYCEISNKQKFKLIIIIILIAIFLYRITIVLVWSQQINNKPILDQSLSTQQTKDIKQNIPKNQQSQQVSFQVRNSVQQQPSQIKQQYSNTQQQQYLSIQRQIPKLQQPESTNNPTEQKNQQKQYSSKPIYEQKNQQQQFFNQMINSIKQLRSNKFRVKTPDIYYDTFNTVKYSKQLPFCIIIRKIDSSGQLQQIMDSIYAQNYTNFNVIYSGAEQLEIQDITIKYSDIDEQQQHDQIYAIKKLAQIGCSKTSIVVPFRHRMKQESLKKLNILYQRQNIWLTYQARPSQNYTSISSFYYQVLDQITYKMIKKVPKNNFQLQLQKFAYSMIHLARYHADVFPLQWLCQQVPHKEGISFFYGIINPTLKPYNQNIMMYLEPNYQTQQQVINYLNKMNSTSPPENKYKPRNQITLPMMLKALQYTALKKLPKNHTLFERQIVEYQQKYPLSALKSEIPLCIIILGRQNIQDNRYKKVLDTIKMQRYNNYHIVFIDDASTDKTFEQSQKYLKQIGLYSKTKMLKNDKQMYATYNIQNAIHNYCNSKQVAVLVDGDDQLIGTQVFKLINYGYQQKQNWIVYFSFFSTIYMYGVSQVPKPQFFINDQPRQQMKVIGALRTFYVDLYRKIKMEDHKDNDGNFFDSLYDDAMQHPMLQMSGLQHTRYIPEVVYFYNQDYGRNDGTTEQGRRNWKRHQLQVLTRQKYEPLQRLFD